MELRDHLGIIWRRKWQILVVSAAVAGLVFAWSSRRPDVYRAETELLVTPSELGADADERSLFLAASWAQVATTDPVIRDAIERSGLDITLGEGRTRLSASSADDVGFITLVATGPTPRATIGLAGGAADALLAAVADQQERHRAEALEPVLTQIDDVRAALERVDQDTPTARSRLAELDALVGQRAQLAARPVDRLEVVGPPATGGSPVGPVPLRDATMAFLVAFVLNAELAVAARALSDRFSLVDDDEVSRVTGLPVLARIPPDTEGTAVEPFRLLRTHLMFLGSKDDIRVLAVIGNGRGVGRTEVSIGLATSAARLDLPVVLVDGDLRHPAIHNSFDLPLRPGLGDLWSGDDPVTLAVAARGLPGLRVIPAGSRPEDPAGLASDAFGDALSKLAADADLVVVDTPAADLFAEATALAAQCDAVVLVIDPAARRRAVKRLIANLHQVGAVPIGIVLNRSPA